MAFSYMHLIERWGTGMLRIAEMIREAGLGDLEIIDGGTELRFNIYRKHNTGQTPKAEQVSGQSAGQTPETEQISGQNAGQTPEENIQEELLKLSSDEKTVLNVLQTSPQIIVRDIAQQLDFSRSAVSRLMRKLKDKGIIERIGSNRKGYWKIQL
ncbi:MarR family transcriptional regulator [Phascolarctobacterium succinatutens]|uniref:MarR family transcriptional regulator n=1 Tax=Phascolarctobacterium succinatutens TaxID=626940 RepID=UPI003AAC94A3